MRLGDMVFSDLLLLPDGSTRFKGCPGSEQQLVVATVHGFDVLAALEQLINWAQEIDRANTCENLANSLLAIILQDLEREERLHKVPQCLLLPFPYDGQPTDSLTRTKGIRAKLRENQLPPLNDDMRQLRNLIKDNGLKVL